MEVTRKVMVLDDNIMDVMKAEKHLTAGGYEVVTLTSPNGALSKIDYERPEILLLDFEMPRLNVADLLETLRTNDDFDDLVIVLYSDMDAEKLQKICIDNDINGYYCKSMDVTKIAGFLDQFYDP